MARRIVLLNPRRQNAFEALFCLIGAAVSLAFWIGAGPLAGIPELQDEAVSGLLYAALPLGLFFGVRQAARALDSPGIVIRPEGLQIGKRAMLPWTAVEHVRVERKGSKQDDSRGVIVIELDKTACEGTNVKHTTHRIDVHQHHTTISWILDALRENASEAGIELPDVAGSSS